MPKTIACVVGTRPEAVKLAPVIRRLQADPDAFDTMVISTGQHGNMLTDVFDYFSYQPDVVLDLMVPNQALWELTARATRQLGAHFHEYTPDWVLVQGDTTSAFVAAYCAFLAGCRVGHVEAGLRTYRKYSPFPEEMNRKLICSVADLHFAPTQRSVQALQAEGVPLECIFLTGNTIVDALHIAQEILEAQSMNLPAVIHLPDNPIKLVLATSHRRENHESGLANICLALKRFVTERPDYHVVFQVHPNPVVKSLVNEMFSGVAGVTLIDPQPYGVFVRLMAKAEFILTDSGGIQEEGPSLGKPVLVARDDTERPEAIEAGCNELVGIEIEGILQGMRSLAVDKGKYAKMSKVRNPFGNGDTAEKIAELLKSK
jgi:UDP-N-acetylglucosamine 2-epimerase (non-hydrolysing)